MEDPEAVNLMVAVNPMARKVVNYGFKQQMNGENVNK